MAELTKEEVWKIKMAEFTEEEIEETLKKLTSVIKGKPADTSNNFSGFVDQILWPEFKQIKDKVGLFGFINGESCAACTQYLKNLKNLGTLKSRMTLVLLMKPHMDEVLHADGVTVPFTRIYNGGNEPIWEVQGVLYSTQIESLYKAYKTLSDGTNHHTMDEFKVFQAKSKVMDVQAFQVKEFVNMDIMGKTVVARPGQYVVFWRHSGAVDVLDETEFDSRFDRV